MRSFKSQSLCFSALVIIWIQSKFAHRSQHEIWGLRHWSCFTKAKWICHLYSLPHSMLFVLLYLHGSNFTWSNVGSPLCGCTSIYVVWVLAIIRPFCVRVKCAAAGEPHGGESSTTGGALTDLPLGIASHRWRLFASNAPREGRCATNGGPYWCPRSPCRLFDRYTSRSFLPLRISSYPSTASRSHSHWPCHRLPFRSLQLGQPAGNYLNFPIRLISPLVCFSKCT